MCTHYSQTPGPVSHCGEIAKTETVEYVGSVQHLTKVYLDSPQWTSQP